MSPLVRAALPAFAIACYAGLAERAAAQSGEQGNVCVHDFSAGVSCDTSTDVQVVALTPVDLIDPCGPDATATLTLDVTLACGAASRFDVGFILALDGGSALS